MMHLLTEDDVPGGEPASVPQRADNVTVRPSRSLGVAISLAKRAAEITLSLAVFVGLWEGIVRIFNVQPYMFPSASATVVALWHGLIDGSYGAALAVTMTEVLVGLAIGAGLGLVLGIALVTLPLFERITYPYIVALQTVPKVAIAPLCVVWLGLGVQSKLLIVAITCLFPVLVNTMAGLRATDSDRIALVKSLRGSRIQLLRYVQLPSALPYIFAGLNTGIVLAIIGALVGEFIGAKQGIGVMILQANFKLDLASVFALLIVLSASGVFLSYLARYIERRVCFWSGKATK
jgi:NitT/TauT family transport system permease protein